MPCFYVSLHSYQITYSIPWVKQKKNLDLKLIIYLPIYSALFSTKILALKH